jgi:hypothetical protein
MFENLTLGTKLTAGFLVLALITSLIAISGYRGAMTLASHTEEIGGERLPEFRTFF